VAPAAPAGKRPKQKDVTTMAPRHEEFHEGVSQGAQTQPHAAAGKHYSDQLQSHGPKKEFESPVFESSFEKRLLRAGFVSSCRRG
jgi:hypothetical protein